MKSLLCDPKGLSPGEDTFGNEFLKAYIFELFSLNVERGKRNNITSWSLLVIKTEKETLINVHYT